MGLMGMGGAIGGRQWSRPLRRLLCQPSVWRRRGLGSAEGVDEEGFRGIDQGGRRLLFLLLFCLLLLGFVVDVIVVVVVVGSRRSEARVGHLRRRAALVFVVVVVVGALPGGGGGTRRTLRLCVKLAVRSVTVRKQKVFHQRHIHTQCWCPVLCSLLLRWLLLC